MKLSVQIPIIGWASAEFIVPEGMEDAEDHEFVQALANGDIELEKFMVEETYPVENLPQNAHYGLNTKVEIER